MVMLWLLYLIWNKKEAWPCHALLSNWTYSIKFPKLVFTIANMMEKESCKNIKPFSCNIFLIFAIHIRVHQLPQLSQNKSTFFLVVRLDKINKITNFHVQWTLGTPSRLHFYFKLTRPSKKEPKSWNFNLKGNKLK